ncbi:hypothetical protein GGI07_004186 [Coemansia sp. Benny D115]|nr:hypothetical protein GGI07_004186 [Coemansia sp. Benny D115]
MSYNDNYDSGSNNEEGERGIRNFFGGGNNNNNQQQQQQRQQQYGQQQYGQQQQQYGQQRPYGQGPGPQGFSPSPSQYGQQGHQGQQGPYGSNNNSPGPRPGSNMVGGSQYGGNVPGGGQSFQHHGGSDSGSGFRPPAPMGRPGYSYDQNDVRHADPSRNSENSPTPHEYPKLYHRGNDNLIKMGSIISLKHNMTGRFLHTDRSHSTQTGSNQQLVFGFRWNPDENDWWQVLPANRDVPVPGAIVNYGNQIRLRHVETGRHLHSHYNFHDPRCGQNEVTAYGDSMHSDENDHWVVERWGSGGYGSNWDAGDVIVLRHYVSGMALHSHDILISEDVQSVTCFGPGGEENDKWRVKFE